MMHFKVEDVQTTPFTEHKNTQNGQTTTVMMPAEQNKSVHVFL